MLHASGSPSASPAASAATSVWFSATVISRFGASRRMARARIVIAHDEQVAAVRKHRRRVVVFDGARRRGCPQLHPRRQTVRRLRQRHRERLRTLRPKVLQRRHGQRPHGLTRDDPQCAGVHRRVVRSRRRRAVLAVDQPSSTASATGPDSVTANLDFLALHRRRRQPPSPSPCPSSTIVAVAGGPLTCTGRVAVTRPAQRYLQRLIGVQHVVGQGRDPDRPGRGARRQRQCLPPGAV